MEALIAKLAIAALPVVLAITLHEAAHAYAARYFGDPTAALMGRISLNPLRHIDLMGTLILPILCMTLSGGAMLFGYAKPVPVDFRRLRQPKQDMLWVAAAGPGANLVMALIWGALQALVMALPTTGYTYALASMGEYGIRINLILMLLNLLPLPPLDGGRIVTSLLPLRLAIPFSRIEPFGFPILVVLLITGVLGGILGPLLNLAFLFIRAIFPLH
ncbi:MAG: site-2 protease family protein [Zoogloeaceae bacterium]|jgi:Zn-dependent protease|nr:site-2 protease family protein [Zoogloeaceae bacterium]